VSLLSRFALIPFLLVELFRERVVKPIRQRVVCWRVLNEIPAGGEFDALRYKVRRANGRLLAMNEEKLIQEVRDFIAAHDASIAALNAKVDAESALDNEVSVNAAERDAMAASHALEEAGLAGAVNAAIDTLNEAEARLADQKSYLVGLLDGIEGTDPTPNTPTP